MSKRDFCILTFMKQFLHISTVFFGLSVAIFSCNNNTVPNSAKTSKSETAKKTSKISRTTSKQVTTDKSTESFLKFWKVFRQAVIDNDTSTVISLTAFPLETRGEMDQDPIVKYERKDIAKVFRAHRFSNLEEITQTINPDKQYVFSDCARISDFVFNRINGQWRWTFAYLHIRDEDLWKR